MQSLCTSLASKEGAVISPAANAALGGVTCPPFLLPLSRRRSLRALPLNLLQPPALPLSLSLVLSLSRVHRNMRVHTYARVCMTRDSSTSSTIHRVRRSTPPRFNIQTICNNFAATITPPLPPPLVPLSSLPPDFAALLLSPSFSLSSPPIFFLLKPPSSAPPSLSFISSSSSPPYSPLSLPILPDRVSSTARGDVAHTNTPTPRLCEIAPRGVVHCTSIFHPATAITLNRRAGINI